MSTRFRMDHQFQTLELVEDDMVRGRWPALTVRWTEEDFSQDGSGPLFRSRAVRVMSEAGWYIVVVWGTFTYSTNQYPLLRVAGDSLSLDTFVEEPELVECQVCADDESGPLMVRRDGVADTLIPFVDGEMFKRLVAATGEFFTEHGVLPPESAVLEFV